MDKFPRTSRGDVGWRWQEVSELELRLLGAWGGGPSPRWRAEAASFRAASVTARRTAGRTASHVPGAGASFRADTGGVWVSTSISAA